MRMTEILEKKKHGEALTKEEIAFFVTEYTNGSIPDYQASALLMAICLRGMTEEETVCLTDCMAHSGEMLDLSFLGGVTADKHSTGGVGDKTTLIVAPICAALGLKMAKLSGRGLGHTGGTVDKYGSIPGYKINLSNEEFREQIQSIGICMMGQTGNLAPADKKLYALRDVTATVDNLSLIAASIMSKKLAAGAQNLILDVKCGSGALMQQKEDAEALARLMVKIGKGCGRNTTALVTNMDTPLGLTVGNALEVIEAVEILKNRGDAELRTLCLILSAHLLKMAYGWEYKKAYEKAESTLKDGSALKKFREVVAAQGGDVSVLDSPSALLHLGKQISVCAPQDGYIFRMDTKKIGESASLLGAGRAKITDEIDPNAGIVFRKKTGDTVKCGEEIAVLFAADEEKLASGKKRLEEALEFSNTAPQKIPLILEEIF